MILLLMFLTLYSHFALQLLNFPLHFADDCCNAIIPYYFNFQESLLEAAYDEGLLEAYDFVKAISKHVRT